MIIRTHLVPFVLRDDRLRVVLTRSWGGGVGLTEEVMGPESGGLDRTVARLAASASRRPLLGSRIWQVGAISSDPDTLRVIYATCLRDGDQEPDAAETAPDDPKLPGPLQVVVGKAASDLKRRAATSPVPLLLLGETVTIPDIVDAWGACGITVDQSTIRRKLAADGLIRAAADPQGPKRLGRPPARFSVHLPKDPFSDLSLYAPRTRGEP